MKITEQGNTFTCDCGFSWQRGLSGSHDCAQGLRSQIEDLKATAPGLGKLPPLTAELADILGRPNFQCFHLAAALRAGGHDIPRKAEAEQAAVIYFMLGHYLEHGEKWSEKAEEELQRLVATGKLRADG
ncbi:hypothetical protein [Serratia sp. BNK-4]|uniref:hypothetical protein n=1 Tax=Serratia sp. BNK-4 TaxID=3376141 RepID=UPI003B430D8F